MKVIFLDFDGVLNHYDAMIPYVNEFKDNDLVLPDCVARVNKIIDATDAKVVISSTWREVYSMDKLINKYLIPNGFTGEVIDKTPSHGGFSGRACRGMEIDHWLSDHPDVTHFVILDDDNDMAHHTNRLVRTSFYSFAPDDDDAKELEGYAGGLLDCHIPQAIATLERLYKYEDVGTIRDRERQEAITSENKAITEISDEDLDF